MKKVLTLVFMCLPCFAMAQIERGKQFVSGSVRLQVSSPKNATGNSLEHMFQLGLAGTYGYLFSDRWAIGVSPTYSMQWERAASQLKTRFQSYYVGPFARRYFAVGEKLFLHVDGMVSYSGQVVYIIVPPNADRTTSSKYSSIGLSIQPGATYFLTNKVALTANLGSLSTSRVLTGGNGGSGVSFYAGATGLALGAAVYF